MFQRLTLILLLLAHFAIAGPGRHKGLRDVTPPKTPWMASMSDHLNPKLLSQIAIPGSHHSGWLVPGGKVTQQLNLGIRYLDFRFAEFSDTLYISHSFAAKNKLVDALSEIRQWLDESRNRQEVVLVSIRKDYQSLGWKKRKTITSQKTLPATLDALFGSLVMGTADFERPYEQLILNNTRVALLGDGNDLFVAQDKQAPWASSWGITRNSEWEVVAANTVAWINQRPFEYKSPWLQIASVAVTPAETGGGIQTPWMSHDNLNRFFKVVLKENLVFAEKLGIIELDFVQSDTIDQIVLFNTKKK